MNTDLKIEGVAELAKHLPNEAWHRVTVYVRKSENGAQIIFDPHIIETEAYVANGDLWERDVNDDLQLLVSGSSA